MLIRLIEIHMENTFTKISENNTDPGKDYVLKEIYVNPEHVIMMREDRKMNNKISKCDISKELHPRQEFTTIRINSGHSGVDVTVVGSLSAIQEKLNTNKQLLKG